MCRVVLVLLLLAPASSLTLVSKKIKLGNEEGGCDRKGKFARDWRKAYVASQPAGSEIESPNMWAIHPTDVQHESQIKTIHNFWSAVDPDPNFQNAGMVEPGFNVKELPMIETSKAFPVHKTAVFSHGQSLYHYAATHFLGQGALKGKDILEVGMGKGLGAAYLSQSFGPKSVEGVDLSEGHVALARSYFPSSDGLQFMQGHAEHLAQASDSKDFVFDLDNAHMYRNPNQALSEAFRVLKPGGKYIFASALPVGRSLAQHEKNFEQAGFRVERREDATSKVIASRDQLAAEMPPSEFAELCTACLAKMAIGSPLNQWEFHLLPGSKGYSMMENKEYIYVHLVAVKP